MKIFLVRHGMDDNRYRGGWSAHDLTPEGRIQAAQLVKHLRNRKENYNITKIISSDLKRALTTAEYISEKLGIPVQQEPQLRDMNNGDLAGMLNAQANAQYPGLYFNTLKMDEAYPNGESPNSFYLRIQKWFADFSSQLDANGNVLIVTHGGVISIIYHLVNNIEWSNRTPPFRTSHCGLYVLDMDEMKFEVDDSIITLKRQ